MNEFSSIGYKQSRRKAELERRSFIRGLIYMILFILLCGFANWKSGHPHKRSSLLIKKEALALTLLVDSKEKGWNIGNPNCYPKNKYSPK